MVQRVRDLDFLAQHQDKLQGKYDAFIEFGATQGGQLAYRKYLFQVPVVATINHSTANLGHLDTHDWLRRSTNVVLLRWPVA